MKVSEARSDMRDFKSVFPTLPETNISRENRPPQ